LARSGSTSADVIPATHGVVPGAIGFFLWVYATERTTPTRLASTITVNPISAGALGTVLVGEPFGLGLMAGVIAVAAGIWIASTEANPKPISKQPDEGGTR
jgi:drug/metabolite transporter (DMT)-like permease